MTHTDPPVRRAVRPRRAPGPGLAFLGAGLIFLALSGSQPAFTGVGCALLAFGVISIARARATDHPHDRACPPDPRHQGEP